MDGLYVFNNPWAIQSMEKHTSYCAMMRLGMPIPDTWIVPPKDYEFKPDLAITLARYARLFDLDEVGELGRLPAVRQAVRRRRLGRRQPRRRRRGAEAGVRPERHVPVAPATGCRAARPLRPVHRVRTADPPRPLRPVGTAPRPLHDGRRRCPRRPTPDDHRHHADDQLVLRVGVQLVRGAAPGRHVAADRLRQCLPRLAGDVAALPLPVARRRQPALVDLLRGDQTADAHQPRLDARTSRSPTAMRRTRTSSPPTPPSPTIASRRRTSSRSARRTSATSTTSCTTSSPPRSPTTPCVRRSPPSSPSTRSASSPTCSGSASSAGGAEARA